MLICEDESIHNQACLIIEASLVTCRPKNAEIEVLANYLQIRPLGDWKNQFIAIISTLDTWPRYSSFAGWLQNSIKLVALDVTCPYLKTEDQHRLGVCVCDVDNWSPWRQLAACFYCIMTWPIVTSRRVFMMTVSQCVIRVCQLLTWWMKNSPPLIIRRIFSQTWYC